MLIYEDEGRYGVNVNITRKDMGYLTTDRIIGIRIPGQPLVYLNFTQWQHEREWMRHAVEGTLEELINQTNMNTPNITVSKSKAEKANVEAKLKDLSNTFDKKLQSTNLPTVERPDELKGSNKNEDGCIGYF